MSGTNVLMPPQPAYDAMGNATGQFDEEAANLALAEALKRQQVDPIWPVSNPIGTERLVDYRGYDTAPTPPVVQPVVGMERTLAGIGDQQIREALAPAPNTTYGSILPYAKDDATGELRWALPSSARNLLLGLYDLSQGPRTGEVTPAGTEALVGLAVPNALLERPNASILQAAVSGGGRAAREAEIAARIAKRTEPTALDRVIAATEGEAAAAAGPLADVPILRQIVTTGERLEDRVSTRVPGGVKQEIDPHTTSEFRIGIDPAKAAPEAFGKNAETLKQMPDLRSKPGESAETVAERAINHMADNLVFLHDAFRDQHGQAAVDRSALWYDGAHQIALRLAEDYGYTPRQIAGVLANLSPQKDWYQNAEFGKRVVDIITNKQNVGWSPEMSTWWQGFVDLTNANIDKDLKKKGWTRDDVNAAIASGDIPDKMRTIITRMAKLDDQQFQVASWANRGETLRGLARANTPDGRAIWLRAYDEAHNQKDYPIVTPEGNFGQVATNKDGSPRKLGWGSFGEIGKAILALDRDDQAALSRSLGDNHKVRSFFNNIISPNSKLDDTTIDTHAINAAHLRPMGASHPIVNFGLGTGGSSSLPMGTKGAYALYHEAYRRAAERLGLLPRQVQSITWEAVRGLFSPENKRDDDFVMQNAKIWGRYKAGRISAATARKLILEHSKGINPPSWLGGAETASEED